MTIYLSLIQGSEAKQTFQKSSLLPTLRREDVAERLERPVESDHTKEVKLIVG